MKPVEEIAREIIVANGKCICAGCEDKIAEVLRRDRAEQREEMCRLLCCMCQDCPSEFQDCDPKKSPFVHTVKRDGFLVWVNCEASAIRARGED